MHLYEKETVKVEKFHPSNTFLYGTIVENAYTGWLLIRKKYLDLLEGPYEIRLNFTGRRRA